MAKAKKKGGKKRAKNKKRNPFEDQKRVGKKLLPPLLSHLGPIKDAGWIPKQLPEFLWIDSLLNSYNRGLALHYFNKTLDLLDEFNPDKNNPLLGLVSSFKQIPKELRERAKEKIQPLVKQAILEPFGDILLLYSESPMNWLIIDEWKDAHDFNLESTLGKLKRAVSLLMDGKSHHSSLRRSVPLNRMFKHNKLFLITKNVSEELLDGIPKYPECPEPQRAHVESFARNTMSMIIMHREEFYDWGSYFWRHNYQISVCEFSEYPSEAQDTEKTIQQILSVTENMMSELTTTLRQIFRKVQVDLYTPDKDEVLFGLLSRQYRLFVALATSPYLWAADLARIILRCMADTLISFKWLLFNNDLGLYRSFKEYGLGKEKLLKLHVEQILGNIEEKNSSLSSLKESLEDSINSETWEELLPIDLGGWSGLDTRRIAEKVGLKDLYRLLYSPTSADVHGEWISLRDSNLRRCINPLHRFHRVPTFEFPLISPNFIFTAAHLFKDLFKEWGKNYSVIETLSFVDNGLKLISDIIEQD